jgi:hypothetical protein
MIPQLGRVYVDIRKTLNPADPARVGELTYYTDFAGSAHSEKAYIVAQKSFDSDTYATPLVSNNGVVDILTRRVAIDPSFGPMSLFPQDFQKASYFSALDVWAATQLPIAKKVLQQTGKNSLYDLTLADKPANINDQIDGAITLGQVTSGAMSGLGIAIVCYDNPWGLLGCGLGTLFWSLFGAAEGLLVTYDGQQLENCLAGNDGYCDLPSGGVSNDGGMGDAGAPDDGVQLPCGDSCE